ncbi:MAG: hypothetical protein Q9191_003644 [Dirinaria sp. TL-2023a]
MFGPPVNRAMRILDRSFFNKKIPLAAARVLDRKTISKYRSTLGNDLLSIDRVAIVRQDPYQHDLKILLLNPKIKPDDPETWSSTLRELAKERQIVVAPYDLELKYEYWNYHDIMGAILPEEDQDDLPTGFSVVGHVAHLNLRDEYLPYKHLIAEVLRDKNPSVRTVINKIDEVGEQSQYRTFKYEVLAGEDDMCVEVSEQNCLFRFDYSKVYWNSRLSTEHRRLVDLFQPGEVVCDVMAGVGPFAIPAAKKRVFVWANDLNPDSHAGLVDAMERNKVSQFVRHFQEDGHSFIRTSAQKLLQTEHEVVIPSKASRNAPRPPASSATVIKQPKTFSHYVMNLPASALTFLPSFKGLHKGQEHLFAPQTDVELPMVHAHCFSTKSHDNKAEEIKICHEISQQLGHPVRPDDKDVMVWNVRDVAPQKTMFCASFRLPPEVAFI